jgi:putative inorganic carbon (hco3(-)) transporter
LREVWRGLSVTLWTGVIVALWGLPSHFGNDPTCLLFRGTLDTSCWTAAFTPTSRIFSTLGQPAWLAAYLAFLTPLAIFSMLKNEKNTEEEKASPYRFWAYAAVAALFYADLIFANTRAGYIGFLFSYVTFWALVWFRPLNKTKKMLLIAGYAVINVALLFATLKSSYAPMHILVAVFIIAIFFLKKQYVRTFLVVNITFLLIALIFSTPMGHPTEPFTRLLAGPAPAAAPAEKPKEPAASGTVLETNITDSGDIRKIVWKGALDIWKSKPVFGSGVETYAFAYYQYRPAAHNLTSEWDYLYNKAHNEYLNYLATTGAFGLGSYMLIILFTAFLVAKLFFTLLKKKIPVSRQKDQQEYVLPTKNYLAIAAITAGFVSILISNFFGFSVVIINLYFFLTPAFLLILSDKVPEKFFRISFSDDASSRINLFQWTSISIIVIFVIYLLMTLFRTWGADKAYALGYNLNRIGDFQSAYMKLDEAVKLRPAEPVFRDEYAITNATIASALYEQKDATNAAQFANQAIALTDDLTVRYPNNLIFWKDRFKVYYLLAASPSEKQIDYQLQAINSLEKALIIAPTDAKLMYNLGVLYKENGNLEKAIQIFERAVRAKPDYRDAYYALGLAYHDQSLGPNGTGAEEKAVGIMKMIIEKFGKDSGDAKKSLQEWNVLGASAAAR